MNDTRTLIRSSIISLIIVVFGLFMLCISSAPKLNVEQPLIEGGGSEDMSDSSELSDDDFMSLLESADNDVSASSDSESNSDSWLLEDDSKNTETETDEAGDEDLSEIFGLLDIEDDDTSESDFSDQSESDDNSEMLLTDANSGEEKSSQGVSAEAITSLEQEISRLENVLNEKDTEIDDIQQAINQYDEQISQYGNDKVYPGGASSKNPEYSSTIQDTKTGKTLENRGFSSASSYEEQYDIALGYYNNKQYSPAISTFEKLLEENNSHPLADNSQYWIGECHFARGNYYQAIIEFEKVFSYDAPDKKDDAQVMMGIAYLKAGAADNARGDFSWFLACYQSSEYIPRVVRYLEEL